MSPKGKDALRYVLADLYWHATRRLWRAAREHGDWVEDNAVARLSERFKPAAPTWSYPYVTTRTATAVRYVDYCFGPTL